ncbi:MAG: hypothetical protein U5L72_16180 [Bacteroidales bacterium]|nr:hypothetical protein [Bacteroidales bacterium]
MDLLAERPEIKELGFKLPDMEPLREWIGRETKLGNPVFRDMSRVIPTLPSIQS